MEDGFAVQAQGSGCANAGLDGEDLVIGDGQKPAPFGVQATWALELVSVMAPGIR